MSSVKMVESSREFWSVVEKSGLLSGLELDTARRICQATDDPKVAARKLLNDGLVTHWQASQLLAGFSGLVLGKFELLDILSKGDFGRTYLAQHVTLGHKVALHALSSKNVADADLVRRFIADANQARSFEHRHVLRVLDLASELDRHFLVTPYGEGGSLQQFVEKNGPVHPQQAVQWIAQAAEGMSYIHRQGMLHRELSPASLIVDAEGLVRVQLLGLGHLRTVSPSPSDGTGPSSSSRLAYVAPEQAAGREADIQSDIYSLGGCLYFLLSGRRPFESTPDEQLKPSERPVPLSRFVAGVPSELEQFHERLASPEPQDRPGSMEEVAASLRAGLATWFPPPPVDAAPAATVAPAATAAAAAPNESNSQPSPFKIQRTRRKAKDSGRSQPPDATTAAVLARRRRSRILLLASSLGAMLFVLILAAVVWLLSGSGDRPPVAATESAVVPVGSGGPTAAGPAFNPDDPNDPENTPDPALAPPPSAVAPQGSTVPATETTATSPAATIPAGQPVEPAWQPPAIAALSSPSPTKPGERLALKPDSTGQPESAAKPEPTVPAESSAPPPVAPTFEMPAAVDLPRLAASDGSLEAESPMKVLGRVNILPAADCFISLVGGRSAMKGQSSFQVRNAERGTARRNWELIVKDGASSETVLGKLALPDRELTFEWTPAASEHPAANFLRNCALKITAGQDKPTILALRTPIMESPISLATLEKSPVIAKFNLASLPDLAALRIEPQIPDFKFVPELAGKLDITKADQWIYVGERKDTAVIGLRLETSATARGLQISVTPHVALPDFVRTTEKPQRLTAALRKRVSIPDLQKQRDSLLVRAAQLEQAAASDKRARLQNDIAELKVRRDNLEAMIAGLQRLDESLTRLAVTPLHLRVYCDAEETQIDLVRTSK